MPTEEKYPRKNVQKNKGKNRKWERQGGRREGEGRVFALKFSERLT